MAKDIEDSTWNDDNIRLLDEFEQYRNYTLRATKNLLSDFYNKYFKGNERVLEVGSGKGFLRRNWPEEFKGEWIQLDSNPDFLKETKKRFPNSKYVHGSVYKLPFKDESFDVVCGLGSYDVFMDLRKAVEESARVLKRGGLFFHLLDLDACGKPIIKDFENRYVLYEESGYTRHDGLMVTNSLRFIPEESFGKFIKATKKLYSDIETKKYEKLFKKHSIGVKFNDYFEGKLINALPAFFEGKDIEIGKLIAKFKGKRTKQQKEFGDGNYFKFVSLPGPFIISYTFNFNRELRFFSPKLADKLEPSCLEISIMNYVLAKKSTEEYMYTDYINK